jgi:hypothetical protein
MAFLAYMFTFNIQVCLSVFLVYLNISLNHLEFTLNYSKTNIGGGGVIPHPPLHSLVTTILTFVIKFEVVQILMTVNG